MTSLQKSKLSELLKNLAHDNGDPQAWNQLYELLWARVLSTTYRALGGLKDRAEDAAQEVFYRLLNYGDFSRSRTPEQFLGYLNVICSNVAADFLKDLAEATIPLDEDLEDQQQESLSPANPEQLAISEDLLRKLEGPLDAQEQQLLSLVRNGYKDAEIGEHFGWSYGKAAIRVHRLREKVRIFMKTQGL
jgi:RNA polymerase sigma factor (sigma-70 family)